MKLVLPGFSIHWRGQICQVDKVEIECIRLELWEKYIRFQNAYSYGLSLSSNALSLSLKHCLSSKHSHSNGDSSHPQPVGVQQQSPSPSPSNALLFPHNRLQFKHSFSVSQTLFLSSNTLTQTAKSVILNPSACNKNHRHPHP